MTAARPAATAWVLGLLGTCIAAKAALLAARLADEAAPAFGPWLPIALIHEDVRLVVVFAAFAAGLAAWARARPRLARPLRVAVAVAYAVHRSEAELNSKVVSGDRQDLYPAAELTQVLPDRREVF